jgi:RNA polymerase sigma-70 factor (ECF subfamily)
MAELDEEQDWISQSQRGNHAAFEALISRHQRMIHALTFRMTGSLADAEDLAQDTFIHAHEQLASFRGEARFSSWLYRIALNLCLNWQKSQKRRQRLLDHWAGEQGQRTTAPIPDARTRHIQDALLKLNPKQRAAIILTVYDGLNHAEAARALGCAETTVSWRVFAARAKLKKLLAKTPSPEESHER